jgi:hypothetical protein
MEVMIRTPFSLIPRMRMITRQHQILTISLKATTKNFAAGRLQPGPSLSSLSVHPAFNFVDSTTWVTELPPSFTPQCLRTFPPFPLSLFPLILFNFLIRRIYHIPFDLQAFLLPWTLCFSQERAPDAIPCFDLSLVYYFYHRDLGTRRSITGANNISKLFV